MAQPGRQQEVLNILQGLHSLDALKKLFWEELNYERENRPLSPRRWPDTARRLLADDPILFASGGDENAFHVVYCRLASPELKRGQERAIVNQLLSEHPYSLFVFSNRSYSSWHFLNIKLDETARKRRLFRRLAVRPGEGLRTAAERLALLDLRAISPDLFGLAPLLVQQHHDQAFDVERVTKDFYREIANWYFWARDHAEFPKDAPVDADGKPSLQLIRLLTRLIFCWFLREKRNPETQEGLIPDNLFDPRQIQNLLKDPSPDSCAYYTAILQNLFFATLNTEMDKPGQDPSRRFLDEGDGKQSDDHMVHQFWRHASQLRDPAALERLLRRIPFLNGGIFECLDDRVRRGNSPHLVEIRIDGFSTYPSKQPKIPNFLFFGPDQMVDLSKAYGDSTRSREVARPILSILRRYNFTLTESTPFDQEVALDPELLGHVFENLLAAYNPETGVVARKATGSFYTPRVVVDWMVDQALLVYLKKAIAAGEDGKLVRLLSWDEEGHDFSPAEVEKLIDAIDALKTIDPACGSGAFPMGMLQKLVHILKKLDPENKGWRKRQEKVAQSIKNSAEREDALKALERAFARDNDDYGRKLYLIENCLYGVDIQPIAVQIAKLRFFISLVVDQTINPKEHNYGVLPLPNLETKVVAANTLLGLHRGELLLGTDRVRQLENQLQKIRHDYFTARSYRRKKELRKEDRRFCDELAEALQDCGECSRYDAQRLAEWNPYDTNKAASFFDPGWMFGLPSKDHDGEFNIVIGNPPYVRQEELRNQTVTGSDGKPQALKDALQARYDCFTGTADLYVYFFERSLQLLLVGGVLSFITSNKYFRAGYGEKLRTYLRWATKPCAILDFGDAPVFSSIAYPAIIVTQKIRHVDKGALPSAQDPKGVLHPSRLPPEDWQSRVMTWKPGPAVLEFPDIFDSEATRLPQRDLKPDGWRLESPVKLRLLEKLRKAGTPLGEYVEGRFYRGILTGLNEAFVVDRSTRDRLISEHKSSKEILKPFLRGRDIKRWRCEPQDIWLIFTRRGIDIQKYPAILEHLKQFKKRLMPGVSGGRKPGSYEWYEIQDNIAYWREFEQPKIIIPAIQNMPSYAPDMHGFYSNDKTSIIIPPSLPFILAFVNSSVSWWITQQSFASRQGGFYEFKPMYVSALPIPPATSSQQKEIESLVSRILTAKKADPRADVSAWEREIDERVYRLFGLTKDEIKIVEESIAPASGVPADRGSG